MKSKIIFILIAIETGLIFNFFLKSVIEVQANSKSIKEIQEERERWQSKKATSKSTEEWLKDLSSEDKVIRQSAMEALGYLKSKEAVPALINALNDNNWCVRETAIKALGGIKDERVIEPLITRLRDECKIDDQTKVGKEGQSTVSIHIEGEIIDALCSIGTKTIPSLMKVIENKKEGGPFKYKVAIILGRLGEKKVLLLLIEALEKEKEGIWRSNIAEILGKLGDKRAIPYLRNALRDKYKIQDPDSGVWHYIVKQSAITALGELKATESVHDLIELLNQEKDNGVVYVALGKIGDKRVVPVLIDILENSKENAPRYYAASTLGKIGDKKAIPVLKKALDDNWCTPSGMYPVRDGAANSLKKMGIKVIKEGNGYKVVE
ncbi:MAG: HEAT repeat domain-containing protein [bacterium]